MFQSQQENILLFKTPVKGRETSLFSEEFFKHYTSTEGQFGPNDGVYFSSALVADNFLDN